MANLVCADEKRRFGQGDHYRFYVNDHGEFLIALVWDEGFNSFVDNTRAVRSDEKFLEKLREYFCDDKERALERDPMDLARDYAIDGPEGAA